MIWESLGALHNDIWGVAFLLWAAYLFLKDDIKLVLPLALSILTKYVAFALAPFLAVYYWRRRDWTRLAWVVGTAVICLGVTALTDPRYMTSRLLARAHEMIRARIPFHERDRFLAPDIAEAKRLVQSGAFSDFPGAAALPSLD